MSIHTVFRIIHILGGIAWVGAALFVALYLMPAARAVGPAAGPLMREVNEGRKLHIYMSSMSMFTLFSGFALAWRDAGPLGFRWFEQGTGLVYGIGAVAAIASSIVGGAVIGPSAKGAADIAAKAQTEQRELTPQERGTQMALQAKMTWAVKLGAALLVTASVAMASARYL